MPELQDDIIMEDMGEFQGDPEPVLKPSDRKKLDSIVVQMYNQKATPDEIKFVVEDFKKKYATKPLVSQPKPQPAKAGKLVSVGQEALIKEEPKKYTAEWWKQQSEQNPMVKVEPNKPGQISGLINRPKALANAAKAQKKLQSEIHANDDVVETMIRNQRMNVAGQNFDIPTSEMQPIGMREFQEPSVGVNEQPVSPDEIALFKSDTEADEGAARNLLKEVTDRKPEKKKDIQSAVYRIDAVRSVGDNDARFEKIEKNAKGIEKGELIYNVTSGQLLKPQGVVGSLLTGWQQKSQLFDDFSFFNNKPDDEVIAELERRRTDYDPDEPIPVPKHKVGELSQMLGSMPLKSVIAGTAVSAVASPAAGAVAAGAIGAVDFYKMGYAGTLQNVYYQMREEGKSEQEALQIARTQAKKEASIDAAMGGAMSVAGMRIGAKPLNFSPGYRAAATSFLKTAGKEGAIQSLIGAGGELSKNLLAQQAGIKRETGANVLEAIESNFLLTVGMGAAAKLGKGISSVKYKSLLNGLSKVDDGLLEGNIVNEVNAGRLTEQQADNIRTEVKNYKELDSQTPENIAEEARIEIQKKIERRNELESELESKNKAFHPEIKEKIAKLDEEIVELSKNKEPKVKESEDIKKAKLLIDDAIEEGTMNDVYAAVAKENPEGFMKFVADQSLGRTDEGVLHEAGGAEGQMREQFGDKLVDKALEMFPIKTVEPPKKYTLGDNVDVFEETLPNTKTHLIRIDIKGVGEIALAKEPGKSNYDVDYVRTDDSVRGQKRAKELYYEAIKLLNSKGQILEPGGYSSPEVVSVWRRLEKEGLANIESIVEGGEEPGNFIIKAKTTGKNPGEVKSSISVIRPEEQKQPENVVQETTLPTDGPEMIGITHEQMDNVARELGLETYQDDPETIELWDRQAKERMQKDPDSINKLFDKLRGGEQPDKVENRMMIMHMADLKARYNKNPTPELLNDIKRTKDLFNVAGREWGKAGRARQGSEPVEESLSDYHLRDLEANRAPLTEQQQAKSTKEFEEIGAVKKAYEEKIAKLKEENTKLKADKKIKKEAAQAKKTEKKDYKAERKQIIDDIKKKWDESKGDLTATFIPYADKLIKIAPDVAKLVRNIVEEGITKLPEVIKAVHDQIRDVIPEVTEKDVHDIIAGEYNEKKSRTEIAEQLYSLKLEAKLINKLEALESGIQPKNEKQRIKRNREIEELRQKIKDFESEKSRIEREEKEAQQAEERATKSAIKDAERAAKKAEKEAAKPTTEQSALNSIKNKTKKQIEKLEKQLKDGDFSEPENEPIELDAEAKALRDQLLKLKEEREIRLMQLDYDSVTGLQYAAREANQYLNISRGLKSTGDVSMPFRQALVEVASKLLTIPFEIKNGKIVFTNFKAQRQLGQAFANMYTSLAKGSEYRRIMADIKESPRFELAQEAGLNLSDPNSPLAVAREEFNYPSKLEKVPLVKNVIQASNRAASAIINVLKWNKFNEFVDMFEKQGMSIRNSPDAYKEAAIYCNQVVGRGHLGQKVEAANWFTSRLFFSLRLQASRLQLMGKLLNPQFYYKVPKEVRIEYLKDMAKTIAMGTGVLMAANAVGLSVELDPRSSEFGKVKVGDTVYDIWGGFQQYVTLFSRLIDGATKSPETGKISELGNERFGQKDRGDISMRFLRTKASPELGTALNIFTGERIDRKPVTVQGEALDFFSPLIIADTYQAYQDGGVQKALLTMLLTGHGVGAITYDKDDEQKKSGEGKRPQRESRTKRPKRETRK